MQSEPITIQTHNHRKRITQLEGSSFPYLEWASARPRHQQRSTTAQGTNL